MRQRQLAEMWTRGFRPVELGFKERRDAVVAGSVRTRRAGRRHRLRPQFANDFLPLVSACVDVGHTSRIDDQAAALQSLVVAGGAVLLEDGGGRGGLGDRRPARPEPVQRASRWQRRSRSSARRRRANLYMTFKYGVILPPHESSWLALPPDRGVHRGRRVACSLRFTADRRRQTAGRPDSRNPPQTKGQRQRHRGRWFHRSPLGRAAEQPPARRVAPWRRRQRQGLNPLQHHPAVPRRRQRQRRDHAAPVERWRRPERDRAGRSDDADDGGVVGEGGRRTATADARGDRRHEGTVPRSDCTDVGGGRRQHRRGRRAARSGRRPEAEVERWLDASALRGAQRAHRDDGRVAEARRQRQRRCAGWLERAEHRERERLLRVGIGAARSRREPEPARPARVAAPYRGVAAQTRRRRRRRRREHARGYAAADRHGHRHRARTKTPRARRQSRIRASNGTSRASAKRAAPRATRRTSGWGATFSATGARPRSTSPRRTAISS